MKGRRTMFFQKDLETMPRKQLEELQLERLKWVVDYCYRNVPFYQKRLDECGVTADKIKQLSDVQYIPFTTKEDIRDNYPFGLFAQPMKNIARIHASSGTTGKPTVVGYTKNDLNTWSDLVARLCVAVGVTDEDVVQISFGYGLFTGALGLHYGLEKIGAAVIPVSSGNTEKQVMILKDFGTTALVSTPSYALYMSEVAREKGVLDDLKLRLGLFATDNYGMSELMGPGVSGECIYRDGMHISEDHFLPELIDSATGKVLTEGETGELVITTLTKEGFPLLRYRTKDLTRLNYEPCKCGRTFVRMDKIKGRSDDMMKIRGVNVFPTQIESVLVTLPHIGPHYQLILRREGYMDTLEVKVELTDSSLLDEYKKLSEIQKDVKAHLKTVLGIETKVTLCEPKSIERFQGKAKRIIDLRNQPQA